MQKIFERFMGDEKGNTIIDWTVLMAGMLLMAVSIGLTVTGNVEHITDDSLQQMPTMQDTRPS